MERTRADKKDMVGTHGPVLCLHGGAFDDRQDVPLAPFARDIGPTATARLAAAGDLVHLIDKDNAGLLGPLDGFAHDLVVIDQVLGLFLGQYLPRLFDGNDPPLSLLWQERPQGSLDIHARIIHRSRRPTENLQNGRGRGIFHVDLDRILIANTRPNLLSKTLADALDPL